MASSRIGGRMQHVYGHIDKYWLESEMSPAQQANCRAYKLTPVALSLQLKQMYLSQVSSHHKKSVLKSLGN
jgi:hypothetical protein